METSSKEVKSSTQDPEWSNNLKSQQLQIDTISNKLSDLESTLKSSDEDSKKELEYLKRRIKTISTLLTYLKSKAKIIEIPHLAHTSCGIKIQEGVGLVDKHGIPLSDWSKNFANFETLETKFNNGDETLEEILKSVHTITNIMEVLVKRVIIAESEASNQKEKVKLGLEEIHKKTTQIELMESRVLEMERFAVGTNNLLSEMRERVEEMVVETARQRERATENEAELVRVKRDFESLRSYVSTLIDARESVLDSEKTLQSVEKIFDRIMVKNSQLENEKTQKDEEIKKIMEENVKLRAKLDQKEAQLAAMNEQCKFMALNDRNF